MKQGLIDYFLTVNFDNLMLRALALFNIFPPTYDLSILNDITTTPFHPQSITYLHGQHTGLWLLNTNDEMDKPKEVIPAILHQIKNGRTWIILGYSGNDPIFKHIVKLGRFDNGLYWVGYNDNLPNEDVLHKLIEKPNSNAHLIQGYDADSFCLKLNKELGCDEPLIFNTPFTFLQNVQNNIVDIDNSDIYKNVKERLDLSKRMVNDAIGKYENQSSSVMSDLDITESNLKKEIINAIIKEAYENSDNLLNKAIDINDTEINVLLSTLYSDWGVDLGKNAERSEVKEQKKYYELAFEKYEKAINLSPEYEKAYYNWGTDLGNFAKTLTGEEQKKIFELAFEKYEKAININPEFEKAYYNWGTDLGNFAKTLTGEEQKKIFELSFEKYEKAININPKYEKAYYNWGTDLGNFAKTLTGEDRKKYFGLAFDKFTKATNINPEFDSAYSNWGSNLANFAKLLPEPKRTDLLNKSLEKLKRANELNGRFYNLSCCYALLNNKTLALDMLAKVLQNNEKTIQTIIEDEDWSDFLDDSDFKELIAKY